MAYITVASTAQRSASRRLTCCPFVARSAALTAAAPPAAFKRTLPCRPAARRCRAPVLSMTTSKSASTTKAPAGSSLDDIGKGGAFQRRASQFRNVISEDGDFPPEAGRYYLYVSLACPWAHRTLITRALKGLEDAIPLVITDNYMGANGWSFSKKEPLYGFSQLRELYYKAQPGYDGHFTVPTLWDSKRQTIVNNESKELIVLLNGEFNALAKKPEVDLYPEGLRAEIDEVADSFYEDVNNGVYKCGFATTQEAYETAFRSLFKRLEELEQRLGRQRYLCGDRMTLADIRLFTTLVRFDAVYVTHFKTNFFRVIDRPNLLGFVQDMYQTPGVAGTVNIEACKEHYYTSHTKYNPFAIVPLGPQRLGFDEPHDRDTRFAKK